MPNVSKCLMELKSQVLSAVDAALFAAIVHTLQ